MKLVNPANKRKYSVIVVGSGLAGVVGRRHAGRAGLQGRLLLLPGQPPAGPLDRRPGRDQRRQELPERRRQRRAAVLRHDQGGRLPLPRGQRPPARRGLRRHHRPVRLAGRPVRPRVRRDPGQPLVRRGPGLADLLRPGPDRPATPARGLPGAGAAGRARHGRDVHPARDAGAGRRRRRGPGDRGPRPGDRRDRVVRRRRRDPGHRRLRHRLLPGHLRQGVQRHGHLAGLQEGRGVRQPLLHPDPPDLHPRHRRAPEQAHPDVRVAPQRRPDLGPQGRRATTGRPTRSPRTSATTTSSASTRASATSPRATSPPGPPRRSATRAGASAGPAWASTSTSPTPSSRLGEPTRSASGTATSSRCTSGSPTRTRTRSRCGSTRPSTTRWAGSGSTTT